MAQTDSTKKGGFARDQAREIVQRQREMTETQNRIDAIKQVTAPRFKRLGNTIYLSLLWIVVLAAAFGAIGWYWNDLANWVSPFFEATPAKPVK